MITSTERGKQWHVVPSAEVAAALEVDPASGLGQDEAAARLRQWGKNVLRGKPPVSKWQLFLTQFNDTLVFVLVAAAILAGIVGDLTDALVIGMVVLFNGCLGFYQENRAEETLAALKKMLAQTARVRRGGGKVEVPAEQLVPGDVVLLEAGDRVPADGRVIAAYSAEVNESALTGEALAVGKFSDALAAPELPLAERGNMLFMNTVVTRGRLELLLTATGMHTEMGKLTGMIASAEEQATPLQVELDRLGKRLGAIALAVIAFMFVFEHLREKPWMETVMTSIALAVAAIPEGLPAVVTVTLALGMHRMAKQRAIMKKLSAVEALGCTTAICSDKTGTLTLNQMTVRELWCRGRLHRVSGEGYLANGAIADQDESDLLPLLLPAALCNDSRQQAGSLIGDPTEGALATLAEKGGVVPERWAANLPRIAEIPFDSAHKLMATFHHDGEWVRIFVKGAPDVLVAYCATRLAADGSVPLDAAAATEIGKVNEALAGEAMRVIGLASRRIAARDFQPDGDLWGYLRELDFVGLAGIVDPPRPEARQAVAQCRQAGIQVRMITGDHRTTAAAIARQLGLDGEVVSGAELDAMDDPTLAGRIERIAVFARVAPEHKVRIVRVLKAQGHVVAMTGDGVNDAPALRNSDIGVAMGITGTEVTKEAATLVLTDDNFATIVEAVREGRTVYDNIVKFVRFQLSTNIGALLTVFAAPLLGYATPFSAIQILWINIIMDGPPAMTLGVDPARPGIMREQPRPRGSTILTGARLAVLGLYGLGMMAGTLWAFAHGVQESGLPYALTLAFTTFVLFQFFNVFNARSEHGSVFNRNFLRNWKLWAGLGLVLALQILVVHWGPAQSVFRTVDLTLVDWLLAATLGSSLLLLEELRKLLLRLGRGRA